MTRFTTTRTYEDRPGRAAYVWDKYRNILSGKRLLDVGADKCHLRSHIDGATQYVGIGLGGSPDAVVDLEKQKLPYPDNTFDVVLCIEVLEHLDNLHAVFDDLCRVSRRHVVLSLPNPLGSLWRRMHRFRDDRPGQMLKFYGLPLHPPEDRHKWFFSADEAEAFVRGRAALNGMQVTQLDFESKSAPEAGRRWMLRRLTQRLLLRRDFSPSALRPTTLWAVLEKPSSASHA